jgi:hypothetical protein
LCLDLTGSEPYYNAPRRKLNLAGRTKMHVDTIKAVGNVLQQGLRGPYARWSVTRHAQKTRHARQDLRDAVYIARNRRTNEKG